MNSATRLTNIQSLIVKLSEEVNAYSHTLTEERNLLNRSNSVFEDYKHINENIELKDEESILLTNVMREFQAKRREAKLGLKLYEDNQDSISTIRKMLTSVNLQTTIKPQTYTIRSKEGLELLESIASFQARSKVPLVDSDNKPLSETIIDCEILTLKDNKEKVVEVSLPISEVASDNNVEVVGVEETLTASKELPPLPDLNIESNGTSFKIPSEKELKEIKLREEVQGKYLETLLKDVKKQIKLPEEKCYHLLTRKTRKWMLLVEGRVVYSDKKLYNVIKHAITNELRLVVDKSYKKEVEDYVDANSSILESQIKCKIAN